MLNILLEFVYSSLTLVLSYKRSLESAGNILIPITAYKAIDGNLFETKNAALRHERGLRRKPGIAEFLNSGMYPYAVTARTYETIAYQVLQAWEKYKANQRPVLVFDSVEPKTSAGNVRLKRQIASKVAPWVTKFWGSQLSDGLGLGQGRQTVGLKIVTAWEQFQAGAYVELVSPVVRAKIPLSRAKMPLDRLGLSVRAMNRLLAANILTLGQLLAVPGGGLRRLNGMGPVLVTEIQTVLERKGLNLGQLAV